MNNPVGPTEHSPTYAAITPEIEQRFLKAAHKRNLPKLEALIHEFGPMIVKASGAIQQTIPGIDGSPHSLFETKGNAIGQAVVGDPFIMYHKIPPIHQFDSHELNPGALSERISAIERTHRKKRHRYKERELQLPKILDLLIQNGCDVNTPLNDRTTSLHLVLKDNKLDLAIKLALAGANLTALDDRAKLPLDYVEDSDLKKAMSIIFTKVFPGYEEKALNAKHAEEIKLKRQEQAMALNQAIMMQNEQEVVQLLDQGIDPNIEYQNTNENTPVFLIALTHGTKGMIKAFLEKGVDIHRKINLSARNCNYHSALLLRNEPELLALFIERGLDINERLVGSGNEITDLFWHAIALFGHVEALQLCLKKGVNVHALTAKGFTIFELLQPQIHPKIAEHYEEVKNKLKLMETANSKNPLPWHYCFELATAEKNQFRSVLEKVIRDPTLNETVRKTFQDICSANDADALNELYFRMHVQAPLFKQVDQLLSTLNQLMSGSSPVHQKILQMFESYKLL